MNVKLHLWLFLLPPLLLLLPTSASAGLRTPLLVAEPGQGFFRDIISPVTLFSLLLILAMLSLDCDRQGRHRRWTRAFDTALFTLQAAAFALLLWRSQGTSAADGITTPHRCLLPLAPVPLLLLLIQRMVPTGDQADAQHATHRAFIIYTILLAIFMAATTLGRLLGLPQQLAMATIAVRSLSYALFIYPKPSAT